MRQNNIRFFESKLYGDNEFQLVGPASLKNGGSNAAWAVNLPLAWTLNRPLLACKKLQSYSVCSMSKVEVLTAVVEQ